MADFHSSKWGDASPYVRRVIAVYLSLPEVKKRPGEPRAGDLKTAAAWEAEGLSLELALSGMAWAALCRLRRDPRPGPLPAIGSLAYFRPAIESLCHEPFGGDMFGAWRLVWLHWAQTLSDYGWQDPGSSWPDFTARQVEKEKYYRLRQAKIARRAAKWGVTLGEAEARMLERARARSHPRQLRLPRGARDKRQQARLNTRLFPQG